MGRRAAAGMDLGTATLRRSGVNTLANALHPKYGLAWTDGRGVFLSRVCLKDVLVVPDESLKLGEFECVQSLHWSCDPRSVSYLCVVHEATVTLWKVSGIAPELSLRQVRKINATPVPQGVLWNPDRDLLCILNRVRASFYFKHCQSKGSYALPPIESGKITCGCWSLDGNKLLLGIGSIVLIYQWDDVAKSISDYTLIAWKIPSVEGCLTTLVALSNTWMVCTVELPLETLCRTSSMDVFHGPESSGDNDSDLSHSSRLFNLHHSIMPTQHTAQMVMFEVPYSQKEPRKIAAVPLHSVLSPDLLHYNSCVRRVTVGSNSQPVLQVFQVTDTQLWKLQDIRLDVEERPKGLCGFESASSTVHPQGVLVMVGSTVQHANCAFLPGSSRPCYRLSLSFQPFHNPDLAVLESLVSRAGRDSMNHHGPLDSYSGDSIFRELHLRGSNRKVRLLRINPLQPPPDFPDPDPSPGVSPTELAPRSNRSPTGGGDGIRLLLPTGRAVSDQKRAPILVLDSGVQESGAELEVDAVSFEDHAPSFANELNKEGCVPSAAGQEALTAQARNSSRPQGGQKLLQADTSSRKDKPGGSSASEHSASGSSLSPADSPGWMKQRASLESDLLSARDRISSELPQQVAALETQLTTQGEKLVIINDRIDYIARLLEETSLVSPTQYQPLSSPELLHVVLEPETDGAPSLKKTFVLDNSRLQLEPIKQTFGLLTVEIIIDGVASVVGSNVDGYIPIKFVPNDTMHITGQRSTELSHSTFVSSTI